MPTNDEILAAISSTEPCTFGEFLDGLPDVPEKGDREAWSELLGRLKLAERLGYVEIERASRDGSIESLMLTPAGIDRLKHHDRGK